MSRDLDVAQHEAAHVVVGVALGLHLREVVVGNRGAMIGYALFSVPRRHRIAWAITLAAGIAFERRVGEDESAARGDRRLLRKLGHGTYAIEAFVKSADALLETRGLAHARVTRALLARDLVNADVEAIARGERVEVED